MVAASRSIAKAVLDRKKPGQRFFVAIAGPPGAGKTTIAGEVCDVLNQTAAGSAAILAMDGFHLDNSVLETRGILEKKGAPETFDTAGFAATLKRLQTGKRDVVVPVFDRKIDLARAGACVIEATTGIIIVEGNYLLLDRPEWAHAVVPYDLSVFIDVPIAILEDRLIRRWCGYGLDPVAAKARARQNDLVNAAIVARESRPADMIVP